MGNNLILIGGGGHCKSVLDTALRMRTFDQIIITDPDIPAGTEIMGCEVVGNDECLKDLRQNGFDQAFITVGSVRVNARRKKIVNKVESLGFGFPTIIDPSANVSEYALIAPGSYVGKNVIINTGARIGYHCIVNNGAIIEHDCIVNDFAHVSVGSILCGEVQIGNNSFVGAGSTVIQCIHVGNNVEIGANCTVIRNLEDNVKYHGIFHEKLNVK